MTVETGDYIDNLDPSAPADTQPLGESNEHAQLVKRVVQNTFQGSVGDNYDIASGPVFVGPIALNRMPADMINVAAEIGFDLNNITTPTRIDDLVTNGVRRDQIEIMSFNWAFTALVDFTAAVDFSSATTFTGIVPSIDGVDVATLNDITSYYNRSKLQTVNVTADYGTAAADLGKKLNYTGVGGHTITIASGVDDDLLFITNASPTTAALLTVAGGTFQKSDGSAFASFTITGPTKTVGLHKVSGVWQLTGDYD